MRALCGRGPDMQWRLLYARVSFPSPHEGGLLYGLLDFRHVFSSVLSDRREPPGLCGLIWPKDVCASIACAATAAVRPSSPGLSPLPPRQTNLTAALPPLPSARTWAPPRSPSALR